jgi:hypothetical protein
MDEKCVISALPDVGSIRSLSRYFDGSILMKKFTLDYKSCRLLYKIHVDVLHLFIFPTTLI